MDCVDRSATKRSAVQSRTTPMAVKDAITADLKEAMKARDQVRLDTLRSVLSAFTYKRVEAGHDLADDEQMAVVQKLVK